jgi:hypothetical protein
VPAANPENMIIRAESDLRDRLNTSAQLTAAAENLRLQRRVFWLTAHLSIPKRVDDKT